MEDIKKEIEDFILSKIGGSLPRDREWMYGQLADDIAEKFVQPLIAERDKLQAAIDNAGTELPDIEKLSEAVHQAYCQYKKDKHNEEYWTKGDYSKLSDEWKEADRYTVRAVLKLIIPLFAKKSLQLAEKDREIKRLKDACVLGLKEMELWKELSDCDCPPEGHICGPEEISRKLFQLEPKRKRLAGRFMGIR